MNEDCDIGIPSDRDALRDLFAVLVCPACHGPLETGEAVLRCTGCALGYPVVDGVPMLLSDEALPAPSEPEKS